MPLNGWTARSLRALLAVLLVSAPAFGVSSVGKQGAGDLARLLGEAEAVLSDRSSVVVWRSEAQVWLQRLRLAVAADPEAPQVPAAMIQIGEILEGLGAQEEALAEYRGIAAMPAAFGWYLEGALRSVRITSTLDDEPHRALAYLDDFEQAAGAALSQRRELWDQHLRSFESRQVIRANILAASAQRIGSRRQSPGDAQIAGLYLLRAGDLLDGWIAARGRLEDPVAVAAERIRGASYFVEAGDLLARAGDLGAAVSAHAAASQLLEYAMIDPRSEGRQHYAAALQLKNLFAIYGAGDGYIGEAARVLEVAVPGHEALSYLRELGDSVSGNPRTLRFANDVFQLVADTETRWFPDEYRRHVNYQWSRVEQGVISLAFGDTERARRIAEELDKLPLEGEYFLGRKDHIRRSIDRRSAPKPSPKIELDAAVDAETSGVAMGEVTREPVQASSLGAAAIEAAPTAQSQPAPSAAVAGRRSDQASGQGAAGRVQETISSNAWWIVPVLSTSLIGILLLTRVRRADSK